MKDSKPVVVGIGELLWDVLPTGKRAGGAPSILYTMLPNWGPKDMRSARSGMTCLGRRSSRSWIRTVSAICWGQSNILPEA